MNFSKHAAVRLQQRCIPPFVVDLLMDFGAVERVGDGATSHYFDKKSRSRIKTYTGQLSCALKEYLDFYAIVGSDGVVITIARRLKKIHH